MLRKPNEMQEKMEVTHGHKATEPQSRMTNTTCLRHGLCSPPEPNNDGFQHIQTLREYKKKREKKGMPYVAI